MMDSIQISSMRRILNDTVDEDEKTRAEEIIALTTQFLLFFLVLGFAATVHPGDFKRSAFSKATIICFTLQFLIMPFFGYLHILIFNDLQDVAIVSLIIVLSSPGGSYSNFYCALFNGDLSLSVALTTISAFLSLIALPLNLFFYLSVLLDNRNDENISDLIDWGVLARTVALIVSGIAVGLLLNHYQPTKINFFNALGNTCGVLLTVLSFTVSNSDKPLWEQPIDVVITSFSPPLIAVFLSVFVAFRFSLLPPQAFAVAIEVSLQNSSIAVAFALIAFSGDRQTDALAVPVLYGIATALYGTILSIYALRNGWTYTPKGISLYKTLVYNHQPNNKKKSSQDSEEQSDHQQTKPQKQIDTL